MKILSEVIPCHGTRIAVGRNGRRPTPHPCESASRSSTGSSTTTANSPAQTGSSTPARASTARWSPPLLEVETPPYASIDGLATVLGERLERARAVARSRGERLVPLGTPLSDEPPAHRTNTRIDVQRAVLGDDLDHAGHCAGTYLHFERAEGRIADQLCALTALDPAFALVNTAPYHRGRRVATCARPHAYRRLRYRTMPGHGQLWSYPESAAEWRGRVDDRFEAFVASAREGGVDRDAVEAAFSPADAVWAPVCLRDDLGTVEWRGPDAAPPLDLLRLAADAARVVERAVETGTRVGDDTAADADDALTLPPFDTLRDRVDAAVARGVSAPAVSTHLARLGLDVDAYDPVGTAVDRGDRVGADRTRELRRRAAEWFDRDLRRLRAGDRTPDDALPAAASARDRATGGCGAAPSPED